MILDRYIYPLDKIYSEAVGVLYPVCGAQNDVPPTPPTPDPQELLDFYWGVWADDEEHLNYFSTTLSFGDEINLSELPEGWYGKAITDYGEVVVNANDIVFGNALDIPNDDSDLTNLVNYTGEDQTLATTFEIYDANDTLLYYTASTDVEIVRSGGSDYLEVTDCMFMYDEQNGWDVGMMVDTSVSDFTEGYFGYTDQNGELQTLTFTPQDIQGNILRFANLVGCPPTGDYVQMSLVNSEYQPIVENMTITYQTL